MMKTAIKVVAGIAGTAKKQTVCFLTGMIMTALFPVCSVLLIKNLVNQAMILTQSKQPCIQSLFWVGLLFVVEILMQVTRYSNSYWEQRLKKELYHGFSDKLLEKYVSVEFSCFESAHSRDIIHHVGNAPQESLLEYFKTIFSLAADFVETFGYVILFFSLSPLLGLLGTGCLVILLCLNRKRMDMMAKLYDEQTSDERKLLYLDKLLSTKSTLLDLRLNNATDFIHHKQSALLRTIWKERLVRTLQSQFVYASGYMNMILWIGLVVFYVVYEVAQGRLSYGIVIALLGALQSIYGCSERLSEDFALILKSRVNIQYLKKFMELPEAEKAMEGETTDESIRLQFHKVSFRYPDAQKEVLKDISFTIEPYQKIALVGENGSGKTTIVKLLCGLYQPTSGSITLNHIDLGKFPSEYLQKLFSTAFQDFSRYQFSVRHNVAISSVERMENDLEVFEAMRQAQASDLEKIIDKPVGNITEDGINLSGGQWQKLALARAYFKKGQLLILDEPTAAMDPKAESELYASFLKMMRHCTCIMVSHRLAIARQCDQIIVLDKGQIVQKGSHDELYAENGLYRDMFRAQSQWYREKER